MTDSEKKDMTDENTQKNAGKDGQNGFRRYRDECTAEKFARRFEQNDDFWSIDRLMPKNAAEIKSRRSPYSKADLQLNDVQSEKRGVIHDDAENNRCAQDEKIPPRQPQKNSAPDVKNIAAESDRTQVPASGINRSSRSYTGGNQVSDSAGAGGNMYGGKDPEKTYKPENPLITEVSIYKNTVHRGFSSLIRDSKIKIDAVRMYDRDGTECRPAPFFSYMPDYSQLNGERMNSYLWWRTNVRRKRFIPIDYSYIILYIIEIVNLQRIIDPHDGVIMMCGVWAAYRKTYTKLDQFMTETVCDYCLANGLDAPFEYMDESMCRSALRISRFREFYTRCSKDSFICDFLLSNISSYDYRTGRCYNERSAPFFDRHIRAAVTEAVNGCTDYLAQILHMPEGAEGHPAGPDGCLVSRVCVRDTYRQIICADSVRRRIAVRYLTIPFSTELRDFVSDCVKCAENYARKALKLKSGYKIKHLPQKAADIIEEYFRPYLSGVQNKISLKKTQKVKNPPADSADSVQAAYSDQANEAYEPETHGFSRERALRIEQDSWSVTDALIAGTEAEETEENKNQDDVSTSEPERKNETVNSYDDPENPSYAKTAGNEKGTGCEDASECGNTDVQDSGSDEIGTALKFLLNGDSEGFNAFAASLNKLPDALADLINDTLFDINNDITIEMSGDGCWTVIDDYRSDAEDYAVRHGG